MDIISPIVDRSCADRLTAACSQLQKAAAVQRQVAGRKQRHLARVFPKLHVEPSTYSLGGWIDVVQLAGFDQRSDDGVVLGAASEPAKSAFFRLRVIGRMERSTGRCRT
jgi:hypothetical protein